MIGSRGNFALDRPRGSSRKMGDAFRKAPKLLPQYVVVRQAPQLQHRLRNRTQSILNILVDGKAAELAPIFYGWHLLGAAREGRPR
jgi:hypothetical protein